MQAKKAQYFSIFTLDVPTTLSLATLSSAQALLERSTSNYRGYCRNKPTGKQERNHGNKKA